MIRTITNHEYEHEYLTRSDVNICHFMGGKWDEGNNQEILLVGDSIYLCDNLAEDKLTEEYKDILNMQRAESIEFVETLEYRY